MIVAVRLSSSMPTLRMWPKGWKKWRTAASVSDAGGMLSMLMTRELPRGGRGGAGWRGPVSCVYELGGPLRALAPALKRGERPPTVGGGKGWPGRGKGCENGGKGAAKCTAGGIASC